MIEKKIIRPFLKTAVIIVCVLGLLLTAFHLWFRDHAEEVIEEMVSDRSDGKVNLKLKKFRFNYFSRKMELQNAVFYTTDSINAPAAYRFKIYKVKIELQSLWALVFNGKLLIDSLALINPDIEAIKLQPDTDNDVKKMTISQELGRIYNSIHDALSYLRAKKFSIDEGKFSLINKAEQGKLPVTISHIHFLSDSTDLEEGPGHNPDNMIIRTRDQNIGLPDGRHRLSFRNLRINIRNHSVEMDSCTISAGKSELSQAAFRFFFDTLRLASVDFGTLYKTDLIKADTVYCTKPQIDLQVKLNDTADVKRPPSLKEILQPLTGDLHLGYVNIMNAGLNIVATRKDHSTTFTSQDDNIEITGLHISSKAPDPLVVKSFVMAIRDYETLSRDSTLAYRFDSVKFINNKVVLNNFTVKTLPGRKLPDANRNLSIPRLELDNLSWDELLFNRNIKASKAVLYSPVMHYKRLKPKDLNRRRTIFRDLGNIDAVTELQQLQIINGQLDMELDARTKITLENADVLISSNKLLGSKNIKSIQQSLNTASFSKAILSINDLKAELNHINFTGKEDQLEAKEVIVYDPSKTLSATATGVVINELYYNDTAKSISIDGLQWQNASLNLGSFLESSKASRSSIVIKNISGNNTFLQIKDSIQTISTTVQAISADELRKPQNSKTTIYGLHAAGNNLSVARTTLSIEAGTYDISDKKNSSFSNTCIEQTGQNTSLIAAIPSAHFVPDIQEIMKGQYHFDETVLVNPFIHILSRRTTAYPGRQGNIRLTDFYGSGLTLINPSLFIEKVDSAGSAFIEWNNETATGVKNNWHFKNISSRGSENKISFSNLEINGPGFSYKDSKSRHFRTDKGEIHINAENIFVQQDTGSSWQWSGKINNVSVKNLNHFTIKNKAELVIDDVSAGDIFLSSSSAKGISALLQSNPSFHIHNSGGSYIDSNSIVTWSGLTFNQGDRSFTIDSFAYTPALSRDSFEARQEFQADYITASANTLRLEGADIESFISDSTIKAGRLIINRPVITAYRDATKPFQHGYTRLLPSLLIKKFPPLSSVDSIQMNDAAITYSQVDKKTGKTGIIPLTHLYATLTPVRNYNLDEKDSLRLQVTALLMGKTPLHLTASESYNDSLAGIHMVLTANAADLTLLNPALIPLVSAKLKSGWLDTLHMDVNANEYTAYGKMDFQYKNLKIAIVHKGDPNSKTLLTRLGNFAANTFLIRHNNTKGRTGTVYFERLRERSFFNYLVKMTISGITSSIGLKKNGKEIKQYRQKLKKSERG